MIQQNSSATGSQTNSSALTPQEALTRLKNYLDDSKSTKRLEVIEVNDFETLRKTSNKFHSSSQKFSITDYRGSLKFDELECVIIMPLETNSMFKNMMKVVGSDVIVIPASKEHEAYKTILK